ncbi:bifunctional demethylmenaquinone methyltransferase/2-methoxy-6-polyprenyl-1,4-benzoquinol methylase UbiE [candidate division KSB1 bacterium]|nr:bifunctional demethylmenaquinone methyltransferase/2-methoxy-6-polyprenyl-1,4-benzoquinol methylase UbiE [candidate division KSB1 bacterium]
MPNPNFKFDNAEHKAAFVQEMFDRIAPRYDLMNRIMTMGRDQSWRKLLIQRAGITAGARVLDIATGTADIALAAHAAGAAQVIAADFSREMLVYAQSKIQQAAKNNGRTILLAAADGLRLPFADNTFDAVVTGFSLRNVGNLDHFLREMTRVTKTGGKVACLEITRPRSPYFRNFFAWYFGRVVPFMGRLISGQREAYSYLPHSVSIFVTPEELRVRMEDAGLNHASFETLMLGTVAIHSGTKIHAQTKGGSNVSPHSQQQKTRLRAEPS